MAGRPPIPEPEEEQVPDVVEVIKAQYRRIDELLQQATEANSQEMAALIQQAAILLLPHSEAEENFVYPSIKQKSSDAGDEVKDGVSEHHHIEDMLRSLLDEDAGSPGYDGKLAAVIGELRHHVEEEEQELLPVLQENSSPDELRQLGERFDKATSRSGDRRSNNSSGGGAETGDMSRAQLYERAKEQGVKGRSTMSKEELAEAIE